MRDGQYGLAFSVSENIIFTQIFTAALYPQTGKTLYKTQLFRLIKTTRGADYAALGFNQLIPKFPHIILPYFFLFFNRKPLFFMVFTSNAAFL